MISLLGKTNNMTKLYFHTNMRTLDDIDISHAISISSLLKITVYDKVSIVQPSSLVQDSLIEIRDNLNLLIHSFKESTKKAEKNEASKSTRQLTPSQLGTTVYDFLLILTCIKNSF